MKRLGLTIRMGAAGFTLQAPEGTTDLRPLTSSQLRTLGRFISVALQLRPASNKKDR